MKKVTFSGLTYDYDTGFKYYDVFFDNEYVGFAEKSEESFVYFWGLSDDGNNLFGGHTGRYIDGVGYDSLDELTDDLETQKEN